MESSEITEPPNAAAVIEEMMKQQEKHNQERLALIEELRWGTFIQLRLSCLRFDG